ncbi:MAG: lysophospholipid acyltransferase family protein [Hyphomicrobiaceae bacterium]|nr:lysophospholipid acyltransferase family protein [Hyphomicrobiaceae bacterium]
MSKRELSYVTAGDPAWKRWLMAGIEDVSGRRRILPAYTRWRRTVAWRSANMWGELLQAVGTRLEITAAADWARIPDVPLVMIANHPFGIADGVAMLALAERLGRPYRILLHSDLTRIPELARVGLPIDFSGSRAALARNLATRNEARELLQRGTTIIIFPAGGVATAEHPFGKAQELVWKQFVVRLIQQAGAHVLPVHFEGQNSPLFHLASRISTSLRLSLIVSEARRKVGKTIQVSIGRPLSVADIERLREGRSFLDELYIQVQRLAPGASTRTAAELMPRPAAERRPFPWDEPVGKSRGEGEATGRDGTVKAQ